MMSNSGLFAPDSRNVGGRGMVFDLWSSHRNAMRAEPTSEKKYAPKLSVLPDKFGHTAASRISYNRAMKRGLSLDPLKFMETKKFEERIKQIARGDFDRKGIDRAAPKTKDLAKKQSSQRMRGTDPIWDAHIKQLENMQRRIREYDTPFERKKNIQYGSEFFPPKLMRSKVTPMRDAISKKAMKSAIQNDDLKASTFLMRLMDQSSAKKTIRADAMYESNKHFMSESGRSNTQQMVRPSTALEISRGGDEVSQMASNYIQNFVRPATAPGGKAGARSVVPKKRVPTHIMVFRVGQDYLMDNGISLALMSDRGGSVADPDEPNEDGAELFGAGAESPSGASRPASSPMFRTPQSMSHGSSARGSANGSQYIDTTRGKSVLEPVPRTNLTAEITLDAQVERAATSIQAAFRGWSSRKDSVQDMDQYRDHAAVQIQSAYRGKSARGNSHLQVQRHISEESGEQSGEQ